jgi:hypothetical protein
MKLKVRAILATACLAGCTLATVPAPVPAVLPSAELPRPSGLAPTPGVLFQPSSRYSYPDPRPSVALAPKNPCAGTTARGTASGLPAGQKVEVWVSPAFAGGFKNGLYAPSEPNDLKLAEATADASGRAEFGFTFTPPAQWDRNEPRGNYALWLVYTPQPVIAPFVVLWQCPKGTHVSGRVLDAQGQPVPAGATVQVKVTTDMGDPLFDQTVPVTNGDYALDGVPAPASMTVTARVPGWPKRTRSEGVGGLQAKWAGYPKGPTNGNVFTDTQGNPLIFDFGGPALPTDPDAPAYFLAPDLDAPDMAKAELSGHVYDQTGKLVPDAAGLKVIVSSNGTPAFRAQVDVHGGAYLVPDVPTGVPMTVDLRINPVYPLFGPPSRVLIPPKVLGHPNILNFGGPATSEDPDAPRYPFPSPQPLFTGPSP